MESKSRKPLVAGNWKMNGSIESVAQLASGIVSAVAEDSGVLENCEVVVAPVSVHIDRVSQLLKDSGVGLSAQNVNDNPSGAKPDSLNQATQAVRGTVKDILRRKKQQQLLKSC